MRAEIVIIKYTPTDLMLVEAAVAIAVPSMPAIGERVGGVVVVKQIPLRPCVLLRVGVLMGGEVLIGGGVVAWAGIVRE